MLENVLSLVGYLCFIFSEAAIVEVDIYEAITKHATDEIVCRQSIEPGLCRYGYGMV